jgi:hypothetical protein
MTHRTPIARFVVALAVVAAGACAQRTPEPAAAAAPEATPAAAQSAARSALPSAAERADRWQILLNDGRYLYEAHLVRASGDSLVVTQPGDTLALALDDIDELRLVQPSARPVGTTRNTFNGLTGMDDAVYKFARLAPAERRQLVAELLRERDAAAARAP